MSDLALAVSVPPARGRLGHIAEEWDQKSAHPQAAKAKDPRTAAPPSENPQACGFGDPEQVQGENEAAG